MSLTGSIYLLDNTPYPKKVDQARLAEARAFILQLQAR